MTRRLLALVPLFLFAGCGDEPTFSATGGTFGARANARLVEVDTGSAFQLRPRRIGDPVSLETSFSVEHAEGRVLEDVVIELDCLRLVLQPGPTQGRVQKGRVLPGGKVELTVDLAGRYGLTDTDRRDGLREDDCFGEGNSVGTKAAVATLRDGDERKDFPVPMLYGVTVYRP